MERIKAVIGVLQSIIGIAKSVLNEVDELSNKANWGQEETLDFRKVVELSRNEAKIYELLLSATIDANSGTSALIHLCSGMEGRESLSELEVSLKAAALQLQQVQLAPLFIPRQNGFPSSRRPSNGNSSYNEDIRAICESFEICRKNCLRSFKSIWLLHVTHQHLFSPRPPPSWNNSAGNDALRRALNDTLNAFHRRPFAVSSEGEHRVQYTKLTELNRNNEATIQHKELMYRIGTEWTRTSMGRQDLLIPNGSQEQNLGYQQNALFELLWSGTIEQMKRHMLDANHGSSSVTDPEMKFIQEDLRDLERGLIESIQRYKRRRFSITFCGMVKAGKSLFLNALIGQSILPSDELPATAWPCRLRHTSGQPEPKLFYDNQRFQSGLRALQKVQYGLLMESYKPPSDDFYETFFSESVKEPTEEDRRLQKIYSRWVDLHVITKQNLRKFEQSGFMLPREAEGLTAVTKLLGQLNDIIRLCACFGLDFDLDDIEWPLLTVEFDSLRGHPMDGIYEFIDTPGIGESFDRFEFESVLKLVAKDSDVIVPVVSFKELARSDWRKLPDMVANNFGKQASTIVCTHLDQIHGENLTEQMATVSKVFWPRTPWHEAAHRIVPCSSLIGMSARSLMKRSTQHKPSFESIWDPKGNKLEYHCAEKILGTGQPDMAFTRMKTEIWMNTLEKELDKSGLPVAIRRLTKEMVDQAKRHALLMENDTVLRQLRRMSTIHERKLLENRRTAADFAEARKEYEIKRSKLQRYIQSCERFEHETIWPYIQRLNHGIRVIETTSYPKTGIALKKTLVEWCISPSPASKSRNTTAYHSPRQNPEETLIVYNKAEAEDFLRSSQLHLCSSLDQDYWGYIDAVKSLAEEAGIARLQALGKQVDILEDHLIPNYLGVANKPNEKRSLELQEVTFQHIKHLTKKSKQQHDPSTSSKKLEERQNKSPGSNPSDSIWRGPANNLATHAISLYIWPGKAQPGAIQLPLAALENQYRDKIVNPWLRKLREEGERLLQQAIKDSDQLMQALLQKSVEREDRRFQREGAQKESRSKMGIVQHTVAMNSNLWAAESALLAIRSMLKDGLPQA